MQSKFEMSMMGEMNYFLRLQVKQTAAGILINQAKYTRDLILKFGVEGKTSVRILTNTSQTIGSTEDGKDVDPTVYRGIIGSVLYLTASRPDISYSVGVCERYQSKPKKSHLFTATRFEQGLPDGSLTIGLLLLDQDIFVHRLEKKINIYHCGSLEN
ncbi:unnamed protein product [Cuscuta europaea]|uniref:Reverse transcriptase Ty1/copia-type domain-containing protein n=1 Tax=Cuscuta europaea TaxID=41803 RepID=A0A9P0ZW08_CUSEU|nr:unnamed protein product [Cuscuta europaea]